MVLRFRDRTGERQPEPYPPFEHPEERTSEDENWLSQDLNTLNNNVRAAWGLPPAPEPPAMGDRMLDMQRVYPLGLVGPDCMRNTMNCSGDTQDTSYSCTMNLLMESEKDSFMYAAVGTLGKKTGNATYTSLSVYRASVAMGVANVADSELETSQRFLPQEPTPFENSDRFFLWYFGRSCASVTTGNCTEISTSQVSEGEPIGLSIRNYIHPPTARGPNTDPPDNPEGRSPLLTPWIVQIPH